MGGDVLQHHDACAVIPLHADSTGGLDQVHAAGVLHIKRVMREGKSCGSVVYCHLNSGGHKRVQMSLVFWVGNLEMVRRCSPCDLVG